MRIVLASDTYPPDVNGASIFTGRLAAALAGRGHDVHEIAPSPSGRAYAEKFANLSIYRIRSHRYRWHPTFHIADPGAAQRGVTRIIRNLRPDVIHVQSHFIVGRYAARTAHIERIPWIATNHFMPENLAAQAPLALPDTVFQAASALAWCDLARTYRDATIVTSPSPTAADLLRRQSGIKDVRVVSCGVDTSDFTPRIADPVETGARRLLFVGRLEKEKNIHEMIDALVLVEPNIMARIVGEGSQAGALRQHARDIGVAHRVQFIGHVNDAQLRAEYANADAFCMPGTAELQSIATLEAMSSGLPIVAADAQALPDLVRHGINGALYQPGDASSLAGAILYVLANEDVRRSLGHAARAAAVAQHDITRTVQAMETFYTSIQE